MPDRHRSESPSSFRWPRLAARCFSIYTRSFRIQVRLANGSPTVPEKYAFERVIFAHCECDLLALAAIFPYSRLTVLVDCSREGDWISEAIESLQSVVVRGSSLHQGTRALRRFIAALEANPWPGAVSVDGPLGPAGRPKQGILLAALQTGRPIIPVAVAVRPRLVFRKSWAGIYLPLPFARMVIALGAPLQISASDWDHRAALTDDLEARIRAERERAERFKRQTRVEEETFAAQKKIGVHFQPPMT